MTASDEGERDGDHRSPQRGAAAAVEADLTAAVRLIERLRRRLGRLDEADIGSIDGLWPGDRADLAQAWDAVKRAGAKREALEEMEADLRIARALIHLAREWERGGLGPVKLPPELG